MEALCTRLFIKLLLHTKLRLAMSTHHLLLTFHLILARHQWPTQARMYLDIQQIIVLVLYHHIVAHLTREP